MLRGGLKGKGFMGPSDPVVKDAKPPGWELGAITVEANRELSFEVAREFTTLFLSKVCRGDAD